MSPPLQDTATKLVRHGARSKTAAVDVSNAAEVDARVQSALAWQCRIDYMFNNAGVGGVLPITDVTLEHWRRILDINLWSVIHGTHAVLPVMLRQGSGHIVNASSISGLVPIVGQTLYNTKKYAIVGLSEALRLELKSAQIAVTVACPGAVSTSMWHKTFDGEITDTKPQRMRFPLRPRRTPSLSALPNAPASCHSLHPLRACGACTDGCPD